MLLLKVVVWWLHMVLRQHKTRVRTGANWLAQHMTTSSAGRQFWLVRRDGSSALRASGMGDRASVPLQNFTFSILMEVYLAKLN